MGQPVSGAWAAKFQRSVPYVDARKWGTGINPVHAHRGPTGRPQNSKLNANEMGDLTPAHFAVSQDFIEYGAPWGYNPEDLAGLDVYGPAATAGVPILDDGSWPSWTGDNQNGQSTPINRANVRRAQFHPWGIGRRALNVLHGMRAGAYDDDRWVSNQIPTETVSEGWVNKAASGMEVGEYPDDNVLTAADSQLWVQTSMTQRDKTLNNERAMMRGTDADRTSISSRFAPMKLKIYSGEERHYDMFPYQIDDIPRPFYTRTAGTGPASYMQSNDQYPRSAMQRTPPPDPSMGIPDTQLAGNGDYGYSGEDQGYY